MITRVWAPDFRGAEVSVEEEFGRELGLCFQLIDDGAVNVVAGQ